MSSKVKIYKCEFCGKEYDHGYKIGGHVVWCLKNPKSIDFRKKFKSNWIGKKNILIKLNKKFRNLELRI